MDRAWLTLTAFLQDFAILVALLIFFATTVPGRKKFEWIGWILIVSLLADAISIGGYFIFRTNMNFSTVFHDVILVPLYFMFYRSKISAPKVRIMLTTMMIFAASFALINAIFLQGFNDIREFSKAFNSLVLMLYSVTYLYMLMKDIPAQLATRLPMFWVNTAVLVYYAFMLVIYLLSEYVLTVLNGSIIVIWFVHNLLGIIHYTMISVGLWSNRSLYRPRSAA